MGKQQQIERMMDVELRMAIQVHEQAKCGEHTWTMFFYLLGTLPLRGDKWKASPPSLKVVLLSAKDHSD